jgi:hypothetical protein
MRNKPGNLALLILAVCVLGDILIARPQAEGGFLISMGTLGALISRASLREAQSVAVTLLGLVLAIFVICRNNGIIDRSSDGWYVLMLLVALTYALWEKIVEWTSI